MPNLEEDKTSSKSPWENMDIEKETKEVEDLDFYEKTVFASLIKSVNINWHGLA